MLLYLSSNSRPDCQFTVHQCARFTQAPKESHAKAVKRLCRYLKGTSTKGLILASTKDLAIDCCCDADFAGLYGYEPDQDPVSVKSKPGYLISLGTYPDTWVSKLQEQVACSTLVVRVSLTQWTSQIFRMILHPLQLQIQNQIPPQRCPGINKTFHFLQLPPL
jgi:hypothetical protein